MLIMVSGLVLNCQLWGSCHSYMFVLYDHTLAALIINLFLIHEGGLADECMPSVCLPN